MGGVDRLFKEQGKWIGCGNVQRKIVPQRALRTTFAKLHGRHRIEQGRAETSRARGFLLIALPPRRRSPRTGYGYN